MAPTSQQQQQNNNGISTNTDLNRQEIQTAIAKAVELRALHAALTQANSPSPTSTSHNARFPSPSPVPHSVSQFSAQDYPIFTPVSIFLIQISSFISFLKWVFNFSSKNINFFLFLAFHETFQD